MRILVTGGAGYIGSVAVERLLERGDEVSILDNLWRGNRGALPEGVSFFQTDLRDPAATRAAIEAAKPEAVMHFAAATVVPESVSDPASYFAINTGGSINLLRAMAELGVKQLVFSSTAAVYGVPEVVPVVEDAPKQPINPYGHTKLMVEQLLPWYREAYGIESVSFRYFNVAGATKLRGEDHDPETHIIPVALQTLLGKRERFSVFGTDYGTPDGSVVRDYVHVSDLVDAHLLALDKIDENLGAFNLGTKSGFSVKEIVDAVQRVTGKAMPVEYGPRREGDPPILVADSGKARNVLGWTPAKSTLDEMIDSAWDWFLRHPNGYEPA
jgi:UDP-glucose 4-epimerase